MGSRNVWWLLLAVLTLGGLVLWQLDRERAGAFASDRPLFEGLRPERLSSLRLDQLERGLQLSIHRDADGSWQIVDPLDFPAEFGLLERLFESVSRNRGLPVEHPDLAALSLAPPRAVLELVEELPEGPRKLRLELGARDIDGKSVFVRADGVVLSTLRNVENCLDRDLSDWRMRRVLVLDPARVVSVRRSGLYALDPAAGVMDFALEAASSEAGWQATAPWLAALDPAAVGSLLTTVCNLQARTFLADSAVEAARFGLQSPDLRLELGLENGEEVALLFRHDPPSESWSCQREGSVHVFRVDSVNVIYLAVPSEAFLDPRLVRETREDVERIEVLRAAGSFALRRDGKRWLLGLSQGASAVGEIPADALAALDLIGALEDARAARFLLDDPPEFGAAGAMVTVRLIAKGRTHEVEFGAAHEVSPGVPGRLFRRRGEQVLGVVGDSLVKLLEREAAEFVERQMIRLPEQGIAAIELSRLGVTRVFVRNAESGRWSPKDADVEAPKSFLKCVDRLLSLRADVATAPDVPLDLVDPWQVVVVDGGNVRVTYRIGPLASDAAQHGFDDGRQRGLVTSSGLLEDLSRIP